ncbi:MAG: methyltransferase [Hyphococcus sp.]|nr:MAG: methyltransferase [Marinicaulis sp.]
MKNNIYILAFLAAFTLNACSGGEKDTDDPAAQNVHMETLDDAALFDAVISGKHRSDEERARDEYRHPKETLEFFGLEPSMVVVEAWPGGGWYSQILAPYLKHGGGKLYAAGFSPVGANERVLKSLDTYEKLYINKPDLYGDVEMTVLGDGAIAPAGTADLIVTFRNIHNWQERGSIDEFFADFYRALKPGGVLGIVEHRADGAELPEDGSTGYVYSRDVIAMAEKAGFDFDSASEINANPKDTKDHPFGVWTLPPGLRQSEIRGVENPDFDTSKYIAIGESDRMTLKFRKPIAADGALLE